MGNNLKPVLNMHRNRDSAVVLLSLVGGEGGTIVGTVKRISRSEYEVFISSGVIGLNGIRAESLKAVADAMLKACNANQVTLSRPLGKR